MVDYCTPSSTLASLASSGTANVVDSTGVAGTVDTLFQPNCVRIVGNNIAEFVQTMPFIGGATPTTVYFHADVYFNGGANAIPTNISQIVQFLNSSGVVVLQICCTSGSITPIPCVIKYWNGSSFVTSAVTFSLPTGVLCRLDFYVVAGASGSITVRLGGTVIGLLSGLNAAVNNISAMQIVGCGYATTNYTYVSQVQAADFDLRDYRGQTATFAALGSFYTGGTGAITDITDTADTTFWTLSAAGGRGATTSALTAIGGASIYAAYMNGRVRVAGGVVTNGQFGFRDATPTSNVSANLGPNGGFEPRGGVVKLFSGAPITYATFNAAEKFVLAA